MENQLGKVIRNVATLDLRTATPETLASIRRIENVAVVLYSAERASLIANLSIGNVAGMIKVPSDTKLKIITGQESVGADSFTKISEPLQLLIAGQMIIKDDVTPEILEAGLGSLILYGQLLYPEPLGGVLHSKVTEQSGQMRGYRPGTKIIMGKVELSEAFLQGLADQSDLLVFGLVSASKPLPNELIEQKLRSIEIMGKLVCHEINEATLSARAEAAKITVIPAGFIQLDRPLVLDSALLDALPGKQLLASNVRIEPDVTAEALDSALDRLIVSGRLTAPVALRGVLGRKCNLLETNAIFYEGELWLIEDEFTLLPARFDYLTGNATLVVTGELVLAAELEPAVLAQRLHKVYNFGSIQCTPEQMAALQARLAVNKGEFTHSSATNNEDVNEIGNAAYLVL